MKKGEKGGEGERRGGEIQHLSLKMNKLFENDEIFTVYYSILGNSKINETDLALERFSVIKKKKNKTAVS